METYSAGYPNSPKREEPVVSVRDRMLAILFALFLGIIFDYFFNGKRIGISFPLYNILLLGFFVFCTRCRILYKKPMGWFLASSILLLSVRGAVYSDMIITSLNILIVPILIVAYTIIVTDKKADWSKFSFIIKMLDRIIVGAFSYIFKPFIVLRETVKRDTKNHSGTVRNIIIGLGVSIILLLIIIPLLSSADMAFGYYMSNIFSIFRIGNFFNIAGHIILASFVFLYVFGYAWSFKYNSNETYADLDNFKGKVEPQVIITILTVVDFIYLLFTVLQFSYLYGGTMGALPQGFTYADYARRGFFELVAVTVINFIILLSSMKLTRNDNLKSKRIMNICLSLLVLFTLNMLISAHVRVSLYEESYGFTQLRLYVHIFMFLLFIFFIAALFKIWNEKMPFFKVSFISAVVVYLIMNYANLDGIIASRNIERYNKTGKIDIRYLNTLSNDAVPEIINFIGNAGTEISQELREGLEIRYKSLDHEFQWTEYNYKRSTAKTVLGKYFDLVQK